MKTDAVVFKGSKDGLLIYLDKDTKFENLKTVFNEKVVEARKFFGAASTSIVFKGRNLTGEEQRELLNILETVTDLRVKYPTPEMPLPETPRPRESYITKSTPRSTRPESNMSKSNPRPSQPESNITKSLIKEPRNSGTHQMEARIEREQIERDRQRKEALAQSLRKRVSSQTALLPGKKSQGISSLKGDLVNDTVYHEGSLRSGQKISHNGSVVVLGDVKPGGEIFATGNVIILGALKGLVHAGYNGNTDCYVAALELSPAQMRIANLIVSIPEFRRKSPGGPSYAYIQDGQIYIAPLM